jgi:hypothetical protein
MLMGWGQCCAAVIGLRSRLLEIKKECYKSVIATAMANNGARYITTTAMTNYRHTKMEMINHCHTETK